MPGKLVLSRKSEFINRGKSFKIFIDEKEAGSIKNDGSEEFPLAAGIYNIQAKHNWMSSPVHTVNIKDGKSTFLKVGNGMRWYVPLYILMLVGLFGPILLKFSKMGVPNWMPVFRIVFVV